MSTGAGQAADSAAPDPLPDGQDLYRPPADLLPGPAGSLVWYEPIWSPVEGSSAWRILYRSRSVHDEPILVSGLAIAPPVGVPVDELPILIWAQGTPGLADICAPSRNLWVPELDRALAAGFLVVVPDGQGLGARGPAHYLIGQSEARTTLDAARAASLLPLSSPVGHKVALWGYSSGGHVVLSAAQAASTYAPELEIVGTAALAPVVSVARLAGRPGNWPGFTFLVLGGWSKVYGLSPRTIFTERVIERLPRLSSECPFSYLFDWFGWRRQDVVIADPLTTSPWRQLLDRELAGRTRTAGPLLLIQGGRDTFVSPVETARLATRLCRLGVDVRFVQLAQRDHDIYESEAPRVINWLASRAAGRPATSDCTG